MTLIHEEDVVATKFYVVYDVANAGSFINSTYSGDCGKWKLSGVLQDESSRVWR